MMRVIFVQHSCFVVEIENKVLIFDWFDKNRIAGYEFGGVMPQFSKDKEIYLFASHKHQDHFDLQSLKWIEKYPKMHFILSKDIRLGANYLKRNEIPENIKNYITFVKPLSTYEVGDLEIRTLNSTDAGVAFLVKANGQTIYHAGDLNDWTMEGAGDIINGKMKRDYRRALKELEGVHIDVAFVVLDARIGVHQFEGFDYFMQNVNADVIFPMHMWRDYSAIARYKAQSKNIRFIERIVDITRENEEFDIEESEFVEK